MNSEDILDNLLSFVFVMSENMVGLTKGNYDEKVFVKKTYEYLNKYIGNFEFREFVKKYKNNIKVLDTIINKNINVYRLKTDLLVYSITYKQYINNFEDYHNGLAIKLLDEEEFKSLKEVLKDE